MTGIHAYLLSADPAWIEESIQSYYREVDEIIICYDAEHLGWNGRQIAAEECIERARSVDRDRKTRLLSGHFARLSHSEMENETYQRQVAIDDATNRGAKWVLQLDTDEILPRAAGFMQRLSTEVPEKACAVDWPMRTFFHRTPDLRFLEVCGMTGRQISSYPGPIAVRAGTRLKHARQTEGRHWRYDIRQSDTDPAAGNRPVDGVIPENEAIVHLSWIRSEQEIERKLQSWGHSRDFDWRRYLDHVWRRAPKWWRWMYRIHPLQPKWWPALRRIELALPSVRVAV